MCNTCQAVILVIVHADEEDYFSKDDDEDEADGAGVSGRLGNGIVHPVGTVTGTFSLRSLVDYDDNDEDTADGMKGVSLAPVSILPLKVHIVCLTAAHLHEAERGRFLRFWL